MLPKVKGLALLFLCSIPVFGQNPPLKGLQTYGCDVKKLEGEWRLEVWGKYEGGAEWRLQLARDSSLDKSLRRCNAWFTKVEKATKAKTK